MTYDETHSMIEAMSIHFACSKKDLHALSSHGDFYPPWRKLVKEFRAANPDWTVEKWRNRPITPRIFISGTEGLGSHNGGMSDNDKWDIGIWAAVVIVVLIFLVLFF